MKPNIGSNQTNKLHETKYTIKESGGRFSDLSESHNHPHDTPDSSIALYMTFAIAAIMILIQVLDVPLTAGTKGRRIITVSYRSKEHLQ